MTNVLEDLTPDDRDRLLHRLACAVDLKQALTLADEEIVCMLLKSLLCRVYGAEVSTMGQIQYALLDIGECASEPDAPCDECAAPDESDDWGPVFRRPDFAVDHFTDFSVTSSPWYLAFEYADDYDHDRGYDSGVGAHPESPLNDPDSFEDFCYSKMRNPLLAQEEEEEADTPEKDEEDEVGFSQVPVSTLIAELANCLNNE